MRRLIILCCLISNLTFAQSKKVLRNLKTVNIYVGSFTLDNSSPTTCHWSSASIYLSNKALFVDTYDFQYDLKITRHSKDKSILYAKDPEGNTYTLIGIKVEDNWGVIIKPDDKSEPVHIISSANICDDEIL